MKKIIAVILGLLLILSGCTAPNEKEYTGIVTDISAETVSVDIGGGKLMRFTVTPKTEIRRYLIDVNETVPMTVDEIGIGNEVEVVCENYIGLGNRQIKEIRIIQKKLR